LDCFTTEVNAENSAFLQEKGAFRLTRRLNYHTKLVLPKEGNVKVLAKFCCFLWKYLCLEYLHLQG
ncbi:hypothetical protein L9F63_024697, partial [Diploptera punctata]